MSNRWFRFVIALLALGAAGAAGYRISQQEQRLAADVASTRTSALAAESAAATVSELKAALHAYVAQGQGYAFWTSRADTLIERLRASVLELDEPAAAAGATLTETLDLTDRVAASEEKAREHVRAGEQLLAGEVVFVEARDLLDAIRLQIGRARTQIEVAGGARQAEIRREQALLALGAASVLGFAVLLLVVPAASAMSDAAPAIPTPAVIPPVVEAATPPVTPPVKAATSNLTAAAAVCTDLARVSQSNEMSSLLDRAARVLDATGVVVWMSSQDRTELFPGASAGYDERLLARIGSISRDAANVTAAAFREAAPKFSTAAGSSAAALAVPLLTPLGAAGVLSAELRDTVEVDPHRMALATIFAAQLASLLGSMTSAVTTSETAPPAQAQA